MTTRDELWSSLAAIIYSGSDLQHTQAMAKKENILDFTAYMNKEIVVKFIGGREVLMRYTVKGVLRGYDTLVNLVLDETIEYLRDPEDSYKLTGDTRTLGLVVCRGGGVMAVYPTEGAAELEENPFL